MRRHMAQGKMVFCFKHNSEMAVRHSREGDCVPIRHPGQASRSEARAGIQKFCHASVFLDSGSHDKQHRSSGKTVFSCYDTASQLGVQVFVIFKSEPIFENSYN